MRSGAAFRPWTLALALAGWALCLPLAAPSIAGSETPAPPAPAGARGAVALPIVRGMLEKLPGVPGAIVQLADPADSQPGLLGPLMVPEPAVLPAELVQVRVSREYLQDYLEQDVNRRHQVDETILGTAISGPALVTGQTELILHESDDQAVIEVVLRGQVQAQTIGRNGPVLLHCTSQTPFESRKRIELTPTGMRATQAQTVARTSSTTHRVESTLPGLRGRIAQRVGRQRAAELRSQVDAIASRNAERRLNAEFDRSVEKSVASARVGLSGKLAQLPSKQLAAKQQIAYRSTPEYLEIAIRNPNAAAGKTAVVIPEFNADAGVAIRVHRVFVRHSLTDAKLRQVVQPLLAGMLESREGDPQSTQGPIRPASFSADPEREFAISWSDDQQWIEIDFRDRIPPAATVAER